MAFRIQQAYIPFAPHQEITRIKSDFSFFCIILYRSFNKYSKCFPNFFEIYVFIKVIISLSLV